MKKTTTLKKGGFSSNLKLSIPPPSELYITKRMALSETFKDGNLRVNKDGVRIVSQSEPEALPPIKPTENQLSLSDLYTVKVIGKGSNGFVQLMQHKWTGQFFALKVIQLNIEEATRKAIAQELKRMNQSSQCPYLVTLYESFSGNGSISMVLEYMDCGSLRGFLRRVRTIPESYLSAICKQVLQGLLYLHRERCIVHSDLKPSNLLINHRGEVKITDLGVNKVITNMAGRANTSVETYFYMSPEMITGSDSSNKSDIWSLGLVVLECAIGKFPYSSLGQLPHSVPRDKFSPELCSFISACLQKDPNGRSSAEELMEHPFVNKYEDSSVNLASYFTDAGSLLAAPAKLSGMHKSRRQPPRLNSSGIRVEDAVLVISCSDNQDEDETAFINHILEELHRLEFVPLMYNLTRTGMGIQGMPHIFRFGIVILSKNYACSAHYLDELVKIMDYQKANDLVITPVYFKITPSEVRDQKGWFGEAILRLENSVLAKQVQKWRPAIIEAATIDGYKWIRGNQVSLAKAIIRDACGRLYCESPKNLIGTDFQVARILSLLHRLQASDVQILGIWGMAGIGKTTIARKIFKKLTQQYDSSYFLQDFHLMCQTKGLSHLRDDYLSKLFGEEKLSINACDTKPSFMRDRFHGKRVLVILDDVSNARDAEVLVGGFSWFSCGHKIILTSRNRQVLVQCKVKELYEVRRLSESESFRLCSQYTTMQTSKATSLTMKLVKNYASGIPLVLRALGSSVQKHMNNAKLHLQRLRQHPPTEIQDAFQRSYDRLDESEKNIFLDLACFFRGENKDHVVQILDGCSFFTDLGISGLIDESLISLLDNRIEMHNVFQDMGRFIVCEESEEAGKRSRLWDANTIADVLTNNLGTEAIEGIFLDASHLTCELSSTVLERMYRLRLLKFYSSASENQCKLCLPQGLYSLPDELRLLHWEAYPLKSLPRNFNPKNLVELNMPYSNMEKLWKGTKNLERLKKIRLSHSRLLTKIPRLSKAWNLEHIDLEGCTSLVKVSSSIRYLGKLVFLNLKDCSHLRSMPAMVHLESLEVLNLSGCSELENIHNFPRNVKELYLARTAITEVPSSIENLTELAILDLENCKRLQHLPAGMSNLKSLATLKLSGCSNLESLPNLDALYLRGSQRLDLTKTTMEKSVPFTSHLPGIQESRLDGSENLLNSPPLQFRSETFYKCKAVEELVTPFYPSIQGAGEPHWQWPTFTLFSQGKLPTSISHSLALRLYALVSLFMGNACLLDLTEQICLLPLLKTLDISENSFSKLPGSIKQLSTLHSLRLCRCKNLRSLPELPQNLELLNAHGCVSLKSIPWSSNQYPRHYIFSNCFNLSPKVVRNFLGKSLDSAASMATKLQQELVKGPAFSICVPASACWKSSFYEWAGSFVAMLASAGWKSSSYVGAGSCVVIQLTPSLRKTLLGFAILVVVEFWDNYNAAGFGIRCICRWKAKKGPSHRLERIFHCWPPTEAPKVKKDHMFIFCDVKMLPGTGEGDDHDILADLIVFEFYPVDEHNNLLDDSCMVKKCGVHVMTIPTGETSLNTKRPASPLDPGELSDEENMVPPYKRARLRRVIECVILEIRKRKREQSLLYRF